MVFDKSISDPANITIEDDEEVLNQILSQFRRCLCKKTTEGKVAICYLDDSDSNYYEDKSRASLVGNEGDVMVNFPEFWYKWAKVDNNKFAYKFSLSNIKGDWVHVERSLLGAYKGYVTSTNTLRSWSNEPPTTNKSHDDFTQYATNRGQGYQIIDFQQHCVIAFMLYAKYKTRDLNAVLGAGSAVGGTSPTATGCHNGLGISDSKPELFAGYVHGLGIEGVYGGIYEWVKGVVINNDIWTITDPDGSTRNVNAGTTGGCIMNVAAEDGPFFDMVPTNAGGDIKKYYSDIYYQSSLSGFVLARSLFESSSAIGVACVNSANNPSFKHTNFGSRLAFRGVINEIKDVNTFKSLPLL